MISPRSGSRLTLTIDRLSLGGDGVGRADGRVYFVPHTAPGERVEVELTESRDRFAKARLLRVLTPSPDRVVPPCPVHFHIENPKSPIQNPKSCGGCSWQHLRYPAQLNAKRELVRETLERIGKLKGIEVHPVLGMSDPWRYRNKVQVPIGWDARERKMVSGFYAEGSHDIVPIDDCRVQPELSVKIINRARALLAERGLRAYDANHHQGWIRHLLVRVSSEKAMLTFVTRTPDFAHEQYILSTLVKEFPALVGIHQNIQPARSNVILGRQWKRLAGDAAMELPLGRLRFRLSPASFFQVNTPQAEVLYDVVRRMAGQGDRLLDLYTGVGSIALWLADRFHEVGGVEENPQAIADAQRNAELNRIRNALFVAEPVERFLGGLDRRRTGRFAVVMDPPRAGISAHALRSLISLAPSPLLYVSCDPGTLARDLAQLTQGGYHVEEVQPVDLFPHTPHIETAVKLTRPHQAQRR